MTETLNRLYPCCAHQWTVTETIEGAARVRALRCRLCKGELDREVSLPRRPAPLPDSIARIFQAA